MKERRVNIGPESQGEIGAQVEIEKGKGGVGIMKW